MTVSFFLLVAASLIFRLLGAQAEGQFQARLRGLLPRKVLSGHFPALLRDYPAQLPLFRSRVLPLKAQRVALDSLCCVTLLAGLWIFPPAPFSGDDLDLLRRIGTGIVCAAFLIDATAFFRMARAAACAAEEARPEEG